MTTPGAEIVSAGELDAGDIAGNMLGCESSGIGFAARPVGIGLSPLPPISTEPIGIPTREAPPGDEVGIAADAAAPLVELPPQVPDPGMPLAGGIPVVIPPPS
jgi:hypothetical protein